MNVAARPVDSRSTADWVEQSLRESIIELELRPGMRLSEQEIAEWLSVSRQPVREALIALARSRLIEISPKRGSFVTKISVRKMTQARFVREAMETAVVRRACVTFDPWIRTSISAILERQEAARSARDLKRFRREDHNFHVALAEGSNCQLAWDVIDDIKAHIDRVCNLQLRKLSSLSNLIAQHRLIMAAVDAWHTDEAVEAMTDHLNGILNDLPQIEAENLDLFE